MKSEPKIFENKKPKQKAFISGFLKVSIVLSIIAVVALAKTVSADPTSMTTIVTESMALAIVLGTGIVFGIRDAIRAQKIIVKVSDDDVDVTVGTAHGVYPVADFIGTNLNDTGASYRKYDLELVFANGESEDNLYVALPGIRGWLFSKIVDAISIAKHNKTGDEEKYEPFEGDLYEGSTVEPFSGSPVKTLLKFLMFELFMIALIAGIFIFFKINISLAMKIILLSLAGICVTITVVWIILAPRLNKKSLANQVGSLRIEDNGLKINDEEFLYRNIKSISMTPPYLLNVNEEFRLLTIELKHSDETRVFNLVLRPKANETEELVAAGCSCTYPALYERIKTDPGTAELFKE
jgi:hypothetical protein